MATEMQFADVEVTSFRSWQELADWYRELQSSRVSATPDLRAKADELTLGLTSDDAKTRALYDYVSTRFRYIGVALGIGRYQPHSASEVFGNGYGDCKDKHTLLAALLAAEGIHAYPALISSARKNHQDVPSPAHFDHVITVIPQGTGWLWLDTTPQVAPFGLLAAGLRDKQALVIPDKGSAQLIKTPADPPFPALFRFEISGKLSDDGTLEADVNASVRGDFELLMRSAFHSSPQSQWKDVAQAVSRLWNFAGTVSDVTVSSPEATDQPLRLQYHYTRKEYPNWPDAMQPPVPPFNLAQLPDDSEQNAEPIPLESVGEYIVDAKIELPAGIAPRSHAPIEFKKDFAEFRAKYDSSTSPNVLRVERQLIVHSREIPRARSAEYQALSKAMNDDGDSLISMTRSGPSAPSVTKGAGVQRTQQDVELERIVDLGDTLFNQADLNGAMAAYRKALALNPQNHRALRSMGDALLDRSDYPGAIAEYREALKQGADPLVHHGIGEALYYQNDFDGAIAEYREAIRLKPDFVEAHSDMGLAMSGKHDVQSAIAEFREALKIDSSYAGAHYGLATVLLENNELDQAEAEYREAFRLEPDYSDAHFGLGDVFLKKGKLDDAAAEFQEAIRENPKNVSAHISLGQLFLMRGQIDRAIGELNLATQFAPDNPEAFELLASAYGRMERYDDAIATYKQMEVIAPGGLVAPRAIAWTLIQQNHYGEAIIETRQAIEKNPKDGQLRFLLGKALLRSGDTDNAMSAFQKALELSPTAGAFNGVGYELAISNVRLDDARHDSEQAVSQIEAETVEIDLQALTIADLQKMPTLAAYWDTLGWVYFHTGQMEDAQRYLSAAWKLEQNPVTADHLGQVYEKTGDNQNALHVYALALATHHAPPETLGRVKALAQSREKEDKTVFDALDLLSAQRTTKLPRLTPGKAQAEFFILFEPGKGAVAVRFISGSEELRNSTKPPILADLSVEFPDEHAVKVVRRALVDCPASGTGCQLVLLGPETVQSLN